MICGVWISFTLKCQRCHTCLILRPLVFGALIMIDLQVGFCVCVCVCMCVCVCVCVCVEPKSLEKEIRDK